MAPSDSSSDEDDERTKQLREATVSFETLTSANRKPSPKSSKLAPSKRPDKQDDDTTERNGFEDLNVTPEFQEFVAKKLAKTLDE